MHAEGNRLEPFCINDFIWVLFNVAIGALNLKFIEISSITGGRICEIQIIKL